MAMVEANEATNQGSKSTKRAKKDKTSPTEDVTMEDVVVSLPNGPLTGAATTIAPPTTTTTTTSTSATAPTTAATVPAKINTKLDTAITTTTSATIKTEKVSPDANSNPKSAHISPTSLSDGSPTGSDIVLKPGTTVAAKPGNSDWMLASVVRKIPEKNKYEVEDVDEDPQHKKRRRYILPMSAIIPIPTAVPIPGPPVSSGPTSNTRKRRSTDAATASAHEQATVAGYKFIHPVTGEHQWDEFQPGTVILALYPESTCFYKCKIVSKPSTNASHKEYSGYYQVMFDDDNSNVRFVAPQMVLPLRESGNAGSHVSK